MTTSKTTFVLPVLLITVGTGWLLTTLGILPGIDWIWTLGLAAFGGFTLLFGGVDKATVVIGPFFLVASCLSILRQTGRISIEVELPILVIVTGILLLIAQHPAIPQAKWINRPID